MKKYILPLLSVFALCSCVEDEGNYTYTPINEVSIAGIESSYEALAFFDNITITPEITGSVDGEDQSNYEYAWYICTGTHRHDTICTEKDLDWKADVQPGSYTLYLSVTDTKTGYDKSQYTTITATSPYTSGYVLLGNKPQSDLLKLDMLASVPGREIAYIEDAFDNSEYQLKNAKSMWYTGYYFRSTRFYVNTDDATYCLTFSNEFDMVGEFNQLGILEPVIPHKEPKKLVDIAPQAGGMYSYSTMYPRIYMTEDMVFGLRPMSSEYSNQPFNRYSATSDTYYKFYPMIFRNNRRSFNQGSSAVWGSYSPMVTYDMDNQCFSYVADYNLSYSTAMQNSPSYGIYVNNKEYGRSIVYAATDYAVGNSYCYAIMKDNDDKYYLYRFYLGISTMYPYGATINGSATYNLDPSIITGFLDREQIFFSSYYTLIFYSVGDTLYAYDYVNKRLGSRKFEGKITYLAEDHIYGTSPNTYWVATYDDQTQKGHIYYMESTNNPNEIEFIFEEGSDWEVNLEVKSILWKGQASY